MAIASMTKSFSNKSFKLRLPFRLSSKPRTKTPPPETTTPGGRGGGGIYSIDKEGGFRQVFRYLDPNNDGKIAADELSAYFTSIGDSVPREAAEKIIGELSKGKGGEGSLLLEFGDFVRLMEMRGNEDDEVLRQAFEVYTVENGGGCITAEGLRRVLQRLGVVNSYLECEEMIRVFDLDGNGVLDFHEFHKMKS